MGAWGYGLFQSDADLDTMEEISYEAGKLAKDPEFTFWYPKNEDEVVSKLNNGLYHQLLEHFQEKKWDHGVVYLTALTMTLGATISSVDIATVRQILTRTPMYDEAKKQMQHGLGKYPNNGEEWDFGSRGLLDTMSSMSPSTSPTGGKGFIGMNMMEDWSKQPTPMPGGHNDYNFEDKEPATERPPAKEAETKQTPTGNDNLKKKGMVKAWLDS